MSLKVGGDKISNIYIANNLISSIYMGQKCIYNYEIPIEKDNSNEYFYFKIHDPTETTYVGFEKFLRTGKSGGTTEPTVNWSSFTNLVTPTFEYSFDKITWNSYTLGTRISIGKGCAANKVYFRGDNLGRWFDFYQQTVTEPKTDGTEGTNSYSHYFKTWIHSITSTKKVQCNGNIMSLRYKNFQNQLGLPCDYTFVGLFDYNVYLLRGPVLPATTLTNYCYTGMFGDAQSLKQAPILPATTMKDYCYASMFKNCFNLVVAPELPATILAESCYGSDVYSEELWYGLENKSDTSTKYLICKGMFGGCSALIHAPSLPATTLQKRCYLGMFYSCIHLTNTPTLTSTSLATECYASMFRYCEALTTPPSLPATTLAERCYFRMFSNCYALTVSPSLSATTLADGCYFAMFSNCDALIQAPTLPATTMKTECYCNMFLHCESLVTPPLLPGTTLADYCYSGMFAHCISLTSAPSLSVTTLAKGCYGSGWLDMERGYGMFQGCVSLSIPPSLPATTLTEACYGNMFNGCIALTKIPKIPATTIPGEACYEMFYASSVKASATSITGCSNAYRIPTSGSATTSGSKSLSDMFVDGVDTNASFSPSVNTTFYISVPSF